MTQLVEHRWEEVRGVSADRPRGRPVKTYLPGRICIWAECEAVLTRYNRGPACYAHTEARPIVHVARQKVNA